MSESTDTTAVGAKEGFGRPLCLSGGAIGADLQFGFCAGWAGHDVIHWSFAGARTKAPRQELAILPQTKLEESDVALKIANRTLGRSLPFHKPWIINLLRRNWWQVKDAGSVYAVSTFEDGIVAGGTAWAVQMFLDHHPDLARACYVFDQIKEQWYHGEHREFRVASEDAIFAEVLETRLVWVEIKAPPAPTGIYAGIGTRDLNAAGKAAIRALYGYAPERLSTPLGNNSKI